MDLDTIVAAALGTRDLASAQVVWTEGEAPTPATARAFLYFEAGARLEAQGRHDEAFAAYAEGGRIKRAELNVDASLAIHAAALQEIRRVFSPAFLARHAWANPDESPIFIVGLPRSGSSLIEQILATHPLVQGMGESDAMGRIVRQSYPADPVGRFDPPGMAGDYLAGIRAEGWDGRRRFTDKRLPSFTMIGLLHLLFPKAVIIHAQRDAADLCLAEFRLLFRNDEDGRFTYDLKDLGRRYVLYRQHMDYWSGVLMGRVVTVRNEALVADPEGQIRALLQACRLPWHEGCLRFHETEREVKTMSAEQVRRPIFHESVGRWRRFEKHLGPLFEALGPYAPK
ncbi:sulfotransferase family protein [Caulobacter sp. KR2-114]|uniref:sulfotransferase family protein n=1 Tax=Caulobacter sp. KR2-114 TaxID=3400912 RepID=UPI003C085847